MKKVKQLGRTYAKGSIVLAIAASSLFFVSCGGGSTESTSTPDSIQTTNSSTLSSDSATTGRAQPTVLPEDTTNNAKPATGK